MRLKRSIRTRALRGLLLSGSILSFIPAFALVRDDAEGHEATTTGQSPVLSPTVAPTAAVPSSVQSSAPLRSLPQTSAVLPRARTRAS